MTQTPSNLTIGILQTGQNRADLKGRFDEYPMMFDRLLNEQAGPRWTKLETYRVLDGAFPQHIRACDGYIVTGSAAGVYEDHSWIDPLMAFIREAYDADIPLLGICFGHQAIAQALGGEVVKWPDGWGVGVKPTRFERQPVAKAELPDDAVVKLIYFHQDQVTRLPEGAERLASSDFCDEQALPCAPQMGFKLCFVCKGTQNLTRAIQLRFLIRLRARSEQTAQRPQGPPLPKKQILPLWRAGLNSFSPHQSNGADGPHEPCSGA